MFRLHPIQDPLSFNLRKSIRANHRSCYLRGLRQCLIKRGSELVKTLKSSRKSEGSESLMMLRKIAKASKGMPILEEIKWEDGGELSTLTTQREVDLVASTTPHEVIASGVVPALLNCLTVCCIKSLDKVLPHVNLSAFKNLEASATTSVSV